MYPPSTNLYTFAYSYVPGTVYAHVCLYEYPYVCVRVCVCACPCQFRRQSIPKLVRLQQWQYLGYTNIDWGKLYMMVQGLPNCGRVRVLLLCV